MRLNNKKNATLWEKIEQYILAQSNNEFSLEDRMAVFTHTLHEAKGIKTNFYIRKNILILQNDIFQLHTSIFRLVFFY